MFDSFRKFFSPTSSKKLWQQVEEIRSLEAEIEKLETGELKEESLRLKNEFQKDTPLEEILPRAFALARETAKRELEQRPFDVQIFGGLVLHYGGVAEMVTGEGKTLSAVAPAYLNALAGKGTHVVTVNEYLARRDTVWMGQIYRALGLSVACLVPNAAFLYDPEWEGGTGKSIDQERDATGSFLIQQEFLRPIPRREAYLADITYGTNHEFGFDYLRDNLSYSLEQQVQRGHHYAIIDEVDSILIDEARTPLIISAPDAQSSEFYRIFSQIVRQLQPEDDFVVDEKFRAANITDSGIEKVEKMLGLKNLYAPENLRLVQYLEESLKAQNLFQRDKDYVVKNGEIIIVDEFTGRLLHGRRYSGGLHQAIEAKEGVRVQEESRTYAKISVQNYFRLYQKIAGMTGTAQTSAEEFHKVYGLEVVSVPTNKPLIRKTLPDIIYKTAEAKWQAVVDEAKEKHRIGQPILIGTTSIERNELLSEKLRRTGVPHELLNAKNNEREGAIIAQAGRLGAVTVATNMAGRGVDIILGGNPQNPGEAEKIKHLGGLYVIGTEHHEARRIDNQLRGRSGRQGDPGISRFFLSLEDDLLRIFGGERIKHLMEVFHLAEDQPIDARMVSRAIAQAQAKVEGFNFDIRKRLLEYDDILNKQRTAIYKRRQEILESRSKGNLSQIVFSAIESNFQKISQGAEGVNLEKIFGEAGIIGSNSQWQNGKEKELPENPNSEDFKNLLVKRSVEISIDSLAQSRLLGILDLLWMNHLDDLEALTESVGLRAYGQKDPLVEYRREAHHLFRSFWDNFNEWVFMNIFRMVTSAKTQEMNVRSSAAAVGLSKVGRNDPCPCGAINQKTGRVYKYKNCGLINAPYHNQKTAS